MLWASALLYGRWLLRASRRATPEAALTARREALGPATAQSLLFAAVLATGLALMLAHGWGTGHARWLGLKLGLVAFLLLPMEGMHAYIWQGWIRPGLAPSPLPSQVRDLERGAGMDDMLRALSVPLLALAVPLLVWLSLTRPR